MLRCGLLGQTLGHSWSPRIHTLLGDYEYLLYEKSEQEIPSFLRSGSWDGLNVTIPYKKTVLPYLDVLSPVAESIGSVNTIVRRADGTLFGDNTDVDGFVAMVRLSGFSVAGTKVLVLGSGGASVSICEALRSMNATPVVVSRHGPIDYDHISDQSDAAWLVNTTPVGMYPNIDSSPLDLTLLPNLRGVLDIVYNPPVTRLMTQAQSLGLPALSGLYMLVAQARRSAELFTNTSISDARVEDIYRIMLDEHP